MYSFGSVMLSMYRGTLKPEEMSIDWPFVCIEIAKMDEMDGHDLDHTNCC